MFLKVDGFDNDFRITRKPYEIVFPKNKLVIKSFDLEGSDGEIIKVLKEAHPTLVGEITVQGYHSGKYEYYIKPQTKRIGYRLHLNKDECKEVEKKDTEESFKDYLFVVDNYEAQELASRPREEWLIMGFSSTDNLFADAEQIHVDEITIRSAIVFWVGDEVMYHKTKQIIETNKIEDYFDLSGAFTLYALKYAW